MLKQTEFLLRVLTHQFWLLCKRIPEAWMNCESAAKPRKDHDTEKTFLHHKVSWFSAARLIHVCIKMLIFLAWMTSYALWIQFCSLKQFLLSLRLRLHRSRRATKMGSRKFTVFNYFMRRERKYCRSQLSYCATCWNCIRLQKLNSIFGDLQFLLENNQDGREK